MMKCLICGRSCLPGAKLCSDCSSARKRAFAATVTQPLLDAAGRGRTGASLLRPSQSVAATARRAAERSLYARPPRAVEPAVPASRRIDVILLVTGLVVLLLIGAYVARQIQRSRAADTLQVTEQTASPTQAVLPNAVSVPAGLSPKNVAETPGRESAATPAAESVPAPAKRPSSKQRNAPIEIIAPSVEGAPPPQIIVAAPAPPPVPAAREAPRPDALQQMNEGLARCANGDLFGRILCDQRVRREYCDGRWGQVPQCVSGVAVDRGQ